MPVSRVCLVCKSGFSVKPHKVREGKGKYCSKDCKHRSQLGITTAARTHGFSGTAIYNIYCHIRARCYRKSGVDYKNYGGRGIKCLWKTFGDFYRDMGASYLKAIEIYGIKNISIDRINNNGNYSKKNCRWATHKVQGRNTRWNRLVTYEGVTMCVAEWAEKYGIPYSAFLYRLNNWPLQKVFTKPLKATSQSQTNTSAQKLSQQVLQPVQRPRA